jgi:hypothetical protein
MADELQKPNTGTAARRGVMLASSGVVIAVCWLANPLRPTSPATAAPAATAGDVPRIAAFEIAEDTPPAPEVQPEPERPAAPVLPPPPRATPLPQSDLAWYAQHRNSWPTPVKLTVPVEFTTTPAAGKRQVRNKAAAGTLVGLVDVRSNGQVVVDYLGARRTIPVASTDLLSRRRPESSAVAMP